MMQEKLLETPRSEKEIQSSGYASSAAVLAGAALLASTLKAQTTTPNVSDLDVLQYALSLENLEANFYTEGLKQFSSTDVGRGTFTNNLGNPNAPFGDSISSNVYGYLLLIRNHEQAHVRALTQMIQQMGGTPKPACTYRFSYNTVDEFLTIAKTLEDTGVSAYLGAIRLIKDQKLLDAALSITTVEARHASYLRAITGDMPFPVTLDPVKTMAEIMTAIGPFVVSCPA